MPFPQCLFLLDYPNYKRPFMMLELLRLEDWRNWGSLDSSKCLPSGPPLSKYLLIFSVCHSSPVTSPTTCLISPLPIFFINSFLFSIHTFFPFSCWERFWERTHQPNGNTTWQLVNNSVILSQDIVRTMKIELSLLFLKFRDRNNMDEKIKNLVLWPISSS